MEEPGPGGAAAPWHVTLAYRYGPLRVPSPFSWPGFRFWDVQWLFSPHQAFICVRRQIKLYGTAHREPGFLARVKMQREVKWVWGGGAFAPVWGTCSKSLCALKAKIEQNA